ncbi:PqqD family protein [Nitrospira sp. Kam-Ns4a]
MNETLALTSSVSIPEDILFRELQSEGVILNLNTGVYFGLDAVGTRIWRLLREHGQVQKVLDSLLQEYDVPEARCREDLLNLLVQMREKGLIEVRNGTAP